MSRLERRADGRKVMGEDDARTRDLYTSVARRVDGPNAMHVAPFNASIDASLSALSHFRFVLLLTGDGSSATFKLRGPDAIPFFYLPHHKASCSSSNIASSPSRPAESPSQHPSHL